MDGAVELPRGQRIHRIQPGEQPPVWQDLALGVAHAPPCAQPREQHRREHRVAILAALALLDTQGHALASMSPTFSAITSLARSPAP